MAIYIMKPWYKKKSVELVPWSTGTNEQIVAILQAFYNNDLSAEDIQALKTTYFPIGAKRSIPISAMSATGVGESHHADTYEYVIIGQEHDNLTTAVNGHTKALLTVQQDRIFYKNTTDATYSSSNPSEEDEGGYMNNREYNDYGWDGSDRRTWCNSVYYNALPTYIKNNIKTVNKLASEGRKSSNILTSADKAFLLSEIEVFGGVYHSASGEGEKYSYFSSDDKRYKNPTYYYQSYSASWYLRSPVAQANSCFCRIGNKYGQAALSDYSNESHGICPAFCL